MINSSQIMRALPKALFSAPSNSDLSSGKMAEIKLSNGDIYRLDFEPSGKFIGSECLNKDNDYRLRSSFNEHVMDKTINKLQLTFSALTSLSSERESVPPLDISLHRDVPKGGDRRAVCLGTADGMVAGAHKVCDPDKGYVMAKDNKGRKDFQVELAVKSHVEKYPNLDRYLSLQEVVGENSDFAIIPKFSGIKTESMLAAIKQTSIEEDCSLVNQMFDMLTVFTDSSFTHRDLHMENILVHSNEGKFQMQAIDVGKAKLDSEANMDDISYLFKRHATTSIETLKRNQFRSEDNDAQLKHYPLHKIMQKHTTLKISDINKALNVIGDTIEKQIKEGNLPTETIFTDAKKMFIGIMEANLRD